MFLHIRPCLGAIVQMKASANKRAFATLREGTRAEPEVLPFSPRQIHADCGWTLLAFDTTPNYTDLAPLPATLAKWKYCAICRVGDHQVGVWSNTVELTVG